MTNTNTIEKKTKWHLIWSRRYTPFVATSYFLTFLKDSPVWSKCQNKLFIPNGGLHSYYFSTVELDKICEKFEKYILKQNIQIFCNKYEKVFKEWLSRSAKINKQNFLKLSDTKLRKLVHEVATRLAYYGEWQFLAFIALEGLVKNAEKYVKSQSNLKDFYPSLSTPHRETKIMKARLELLKIVINSKKLKEGVKKYCIKYAWLNMYEFIDPALDPKEILKHLPTKLAAENELENYNKNRKENLKAFKLLLSKVKEQKYRKLLITANRFAYLKEMRDDYRRPSYLLFRPFWNEVAKRTKLSFKETNYLLADELEKAITKQNKKWQTLARERMKNFALELSNGNFFIYSDQKSINKLLLQVIPNSRNEHIVGTVAFPGKVTGRVKIVDHKDDFKKFAKGDVLVTAMTHPEFLPIIRQASATITDEGGIPCHAAIVAREMKKPCVIGTKTATKILKDGDLVEVDAINGIVNIIKRNDEKISK